MGLLRVILDINNGLSRVEEELNKIPESQRDKYYDELDFTANEFSWFVSLITKRNVLQELKRTIHEEVKREHFELTYKD